MRNLILGAMLLVVCSSCRMPDMFAVSPYYGDNGGFSNSGLDHQEWGVGVSFTWDLNPGRYTDNSSNADLKHLLLNGDGSYWVQDCLENLEHNPQEAADDERREADGCGDGLSPYFQARCTGCNGRKD